MAVGTQLFLGKSASYDRFSFRIINMVMVIKLQGFLGQDIELLGFLGLLLPSLRLERSLDPVEAEYSHRNR